MYEGIKKELMDGEAVQFDLSEIIRSVILISEYYGPFTIASVIGEECAELTQATSKLIRELDKPMRELKLDEKKMAECCENILEEIADVLICCIHAYILAQIVDDEGNCINVKKGDIYRGMQEKIKRQLERIVEEGGNINAYSPQMSVLRS